MTSARLARAVTSALVVLGFCASCGDDDDFGPGFDLGLPCSRHTDCSTGHCCGSRECDRGMCTYPCRNDFDCPPSTLCEHGVCFFACRDDFDCARGQSCAHRRVCEWD